MEWLRRAEQRVRSAPEVVVDGAIALAILAVATIEWWFSYEPFPVAHKGLGLVLLVVGAIGLTIRRQNLLIAFVLVGALPVIGLIANAPVLLGNGAFLMELILLYSVAERCGPFLAVLALAAQLIVDLLAFRVPFHTGILSLAEGDSAVIVMAWFAGRAQARRRGVAARLEETVEHVRDERERLAQAAVAVERSRIATELHGLVIWGVERMNARTLAARGRMPDDPVDGSMAIEAIEETGRETLAEMRRLLTVLRSDEGALH